MWHSRDDSLDSPRSRPGASKGRERLYSKDELAEGRPVVEKMSHPLANARSSLMAAWGCNLHLPDDASNLTEMQGLPNS